MDAATFNALIAQLCTANALPDALTMLTQSEDEQISEAAQSLVGQFTLAEFNQEQRVYHAFTEVDDHGEAQEYLEHIMNVGDDILVFIAWFFYSQFDITHRDTYAAAGRTYTPTKRT